MDCQSLAERRCFFCNCRIICKRIVGKDIYKNRLRATRIASLLGFKRGSIHIQLGEHGAVAGSVLGGVEGDAVRERVGRKRQQLVVVFPQHPNVDIVVPGNEALMAGCTEQSASIEKPTDVVVGKHT